MTKDKEDKQRFESVEVPTEIGLAVKDNVSGETINDRDLLIQIANDIEDIKKSVKG